MEKIGYYEKWYRNKVNEIKGSLTDQELFESDAYKDLLERMVDSFVADTGIHDLDVVFMNGGNSIAHTDSRKVFQNMKHRIFSGMEFNERNYVHHGTTFHEVLHIIFTDFILHKEVMNIFSQGKWYPCVPKSKNAEKVIRISYAKPVFQQYRHTISNIIEDAYIENRASEICTGYYLKCLHETRKILSRSGITYKETLQSRREVDAISVATGILLDFTKYEKEISFDFQPSGKNKIIFKEIKRFFEEVKELCVQARTEKNPAKREDIANNIFCSLVEMAVRISKEKRQEQQQQQQQDSKSNESSDESASESDSSSQDDNNRQENQSSESKGENTDDDNSDNSQSGNDSESDEDYDSDEDSEESGECETGGFGKEDISPDEFGDDDESDNSESKSGEDSQNQTSSDNSSSENESEEADRNYNSSGTGGKTQEDNQEQGSSGGESNYTDNGAGEDGEFDPTDEEVNKISESVEKANSESEKNGVSSSEGYTRPVSEKIIKKLKKQTEDAMSENSENTVSEAEREILKKELSQEKAQELTEAEQAKEVEKECHSGGIRLQGGTDVVYVKEKNERIYNKEYTPELRKAAKATVRMLSPVIKERECESKFNNLTFGKHINPASLSHEDDKIFCKKMIPDGDINLTVGIRIDQSGSMSSRIGGKQKIEAARKAAYIIEDILSQLNIPCCIIGDSTDGYYSRVMVYRDFETFGKQDACYKLGTIRDYSSNFDAYAIKWLCEHILHHRAGKKMLVISISDGLPCSSFEDGEKALVDTIAYYRKKGFSVFGACLGLTRNQVEKFYGNQILEIDDFSTLPQKLTALIKRYVIK